MVLFAPGDNPVTVSTTHSLSKARPFGAEFMRMSGAYAGGNPDIGRSAAEESKSDVTVPAIPASHFVVSQTHLPFRLLEADLAVVVRTGHEERAAYVAEGAVTAGGERFEAGALLVFRSGEEATVEAALAQDAEVMVVRYYPDLGPHQGAGALLRF